MEEMQIDEIAEHGGSSGPLISCHEPYPLPEGHTVIKGWAKLSALSILRLLPLQRPIFSCSK